MAVRLRKTNATNQRSIMKKSIKRIGLVIALASLTALSVGAARHPHRAQGFMRLDGNNNCVCMSPGETSTPPCGGECELNRHGEK
jgi:hypothetical protein